MEQSTQALQRMIRWRFQLDQTQSKSTLVSCPAVCLNAFCLVTQAIDGEHLATGHDQFDASFLFAYHIPGALSLSLKPPTQHVFFLVLYISPLPWVSKVVLLGLVCSLYVKREFFFFFKFNCVLEDISLLDAIAIDERVNGSGWFISVLIYWI